MKSKTNHKFNIKKKYTHPLTVNIYKNKTSKINAKQTLRLVCLINSANCLFNLPEGKILEDILEFKLNITKKDGSGKIKVKFKK